MRGCEKFEQGDSGRVARHYTPMGSPETDPITRWLCRDALEAHVIRWTHRNPVVGVLFLPPLQRERNRGSEKQNVLPSTAGLSARASACEPSHVNNIRRFPGPAVVRHVNKPVPSKRRPRRRNRGAKKKQTPSESLGLGSPL